MENDILFKKGKTMEEAKKMHPREYIKIRGANEHNLKTLMWTFPETSWWY